MPLELAICEAAAELRRRGIDEFHGYQIAKSIGDVADTRLLTAYGTLYRALGRLEKMGLLQSRWEDPQIAADESRPGRRLYTLSVAVQEAMERSRETLAVKGPKRTRRRLAPA